MRASISCRQAIDELFDAGETLTPQEAIEALNRRFGHAWTEGTIRAHLVGLTVNHGSSHHYPHLHARAFLWHQADGRYRRVRPSDAREAVSQLQPRPPPSQFVDPRTASATRKPRTRRTTRMDDRSEKLAANIGDYICAFEQRFRERPLFGGPSLHFHLRAVSQRRKHDSIESALNDERLLELIYATLTAWGMHKMGPRGPKLVAFEAFTAGLRAQVTRLSNLEVLDIRDLEEPDAVANELWRAISEAHVSATNTQIVAGTKALHHLLPSLVPPIDREYTVRFFHENKMMTMGDERAFREIYPALVKIGVACAPSLEPTPASPWHTSVTKMLDNAIIGFVLKELKVEPQE